jgi:hypothetical protein
MKHIRPMPHLARLLAGAAAALLALAASAPAAFAMRIPAPAGTPGVMPTSAAPSVTQSVVGAGMAGWEITLIVAVVALLSATIAVVVDRTRSAHRTGITLAT